jgi:hypothetical protein
VYLVATHSGCFTLLQCLHFTGTPKGWSVPQPTQKDTRLGQLWLVAAAATTTKFVRAERFFVGLFEESRTANTRSLGRYFRLRGLWDEDRHEPLTRADSDFLRAYRCAVYSGGRFFPKDTGRKLAHFDRDINSGRTSMPPHLHREDLH